MLVTFWCFTLITGILSIVSWAPLWLPIYASMLSFCKLFPKVTQVPDQRFVYRRQGKSGNELSEVPTIKVSPSKSGRQFIKKAGCVLCSLIIEQHSDSVYGFLPTQHGWLITIECRGMQFWCWLCCCLALPMLGLAFVLSTRMQRFLKTI